MAGGRILPPSIERLWLGELRRAHAIINIITFLTGSSAGFDFIFRASQ
jgi:hypothetical protein